MVVMEIDKMALFYRDVLISEIESTELLGCNMEVIGYEPVLQLKVTVCSPNYDGGAKGTACVLLFSIPKYYPAQVPTIEIAQVSNFPQGYQEQMWDEFDQIFDCNVGGQLIMPVTTCALKMLIDLELPSEENDFNLMDM